MKKLRKLNIATHRDLGYFFSSLIIIYCLSGFALNHVNDWNPDFIIEKETITIPGDYSTSNLSSELIKEFGKQVNETDNKVYDVPSPGKVKIYYDNASLLIDFTTNSGQYEKIIRRPVFYQSNLLHRNSIRGWKWVSDIFAGMLIIISVTGLFILKGKKGISGRGKWLIGAGALLPILVLIINEAFQ
ncbi:MAG: PepSY-associated TM helix domain-containing protein [Flammeovirgaceae bacterium]|nr:PepSY-associated TM helix domain-containing protein [Flammeovirgaceae bacterium]